MPGSINNVHMRADSKYEFALFPEEFKYIKRNPAKDKSFGADVSDLAF